MAEYSRAIAGALGKSTDWQNLLRKAAPLHDVGKLGTPDHILLKPARLTPDEMEIMKQHTTIGWEILHEHRSPVLQMGATIAWTHHEKWDGSGYPRGLRGTDIPLEGRIVAVADVLDALTSVRPYKQAWTQSDARAFIDKGAGKHFDPDCVAALSLVWHELDAIREEFVDCCATRSGPAPTAPSPRPRPSTAAPRTPSGPVQPRWRASRATTSSTPGSCRCSGRR